MVETILGWVNWGYVLSAVVVAIVIAVLAAIWRWLFRPLDVRVLKIHLDDGDTSTVVLEITNLTDKALHVKHLVPVSYFEIVAKNGSFEQVRKRSEAIITDENRKVEPHDPRRFRAEVDEDLGLARLLVFRITPGKGRKVVVRIRDVTCTPLGFFRYWWERLLAMVDRGIDDAPSSYDEWLKERRRIDPTEPRSRF